MKAGVYKEAGFRWGVALTLCLISAVLSLSSLLLPYARQTWPVIAMGGVLSIMILWATKRMTHEVWKHRLPSILAMLVLISAAVTQVITANELPSGLSPLQSLPAIKLIYCLIGGIAAFILTWLSLTNEKWASGGAALAAAGLYSSVIFFRVSAVQEVGHIYVLLSGFLIVFWLSRPRLSFDFNKAGISFWKWSAFFVAVLVVAALVSPVPGQSVVYVINMILLICLAGCVASFLQTSASLKTAAWLILILGSGLPLLLAVIKTLDIASVFDGLMTFAYRLHPTEMGGANLITRSLLIVAPLGAALFMLQPAGERLGRARKWGLAAIQVLSLLAILYARAFESFFAWLVSFTVFLLFIFWERFKRFWIEKMTKPFSRGVVIAAILLAAVGAIYASVRIATTINPYSFNGRFAHWAGALFTIQNYPVLGIGPDNEYFYSKFSENVPLMTVSQEILDDPLYVIRYRSGILRLHGHNILLETAAFAGLAGLIGMLGMWFTLVRVGIRTWQHGDRTQKLLSAACLAGMAGEMAWGVLDVTRETPPFFSFPVWAVVGLLLALSRKSTHEPIEILTKIKIANQSAISRAMMLLAVLVLMLSSLASNRYASGFLAFQEHRWKDASANFQVAADLDPLSAQYRWMLSKTNLELGQFDQARKNIEKAMGLKQGYSPFLEQAGWLAWLQGDLEAANQYFESAIASDPLEGWAPGLHANLGLLKAYQGQYEFAEQLFAQSIEYHPELASAPYWLKTRQADGIIITILDPAYIKGASGSELELRLKLQLGLSNLTSRNLPLSETTTNSVSLLHVLDNLHMKYSDELIRKNPDSYLILAAESEAARMSGLLERAEITYQAYQDLRPESSYGYRGMALVYLERNQLEQAKELLEGVRKANPHDLNTLKLLTGIYLSQKDLDRAAKVLEIITPLAAADSFQMDLFDDEIFELKRNYYLAMNDLENVHLVSEWLAKIRGMPEDYLKLADDEQNSTGEAVSYCWQAYEKLVNKWVQPYDARLWETAACIAKSDDTDQQIERLLTKNSSRYYANLLQGHIFQVRGKYDLAEKSYHEAAALRVEDGAVHYYLGKLYLANNDYENAKKELLVAADLDIYEPLSLMTLGNLYELSNNITEAINAYKAAVERAPGSIESQLAIANTYLKMGDMSKANEHLEAVSAINEDSDLIIAYDFLAGLGTADLSRPWADGYIKLDYFQINNEPKPTVFMHPDSTANYQLRLPDTNHGDAIKLNFWVGLSPESWNQEGDGAEFLVNLSFTGESKELSRIYMDPKNNQTDRQWKFVTLDLTSMAGKEITITFETTCGPAKDCRYDWAGWGNPYIETVQLP